MTNDLPKSAGNLSAETLVRIAVETGRRPLSPRRAAELAAEVDRLNAVVMNAAGKWVEAIAGPENFRTTLEQLRDTCAEDCGAR